jgi:hypothetical protein
LPSWWKEAALSALTGDLAATDIHSPFTQAELSNRERTYARF